jgi:hypothetical protein
VVTANVVGLAVASMNRRRDMTETREAETILEALAVIDRGLGSIAERSLVSASEVADLLLDVRTLLTRPEVVSVN